MLLVEFDLVDPVGLDPCAVLVETAVAVGSQHRNLPVLALSVQAVLHQALELVRATLLGEGTLLPHVPKPDGAVLACCCQGV